METLDTSILNEAERLAERYRFFQELKVQEEGLKKFNQFNLDRIKRICEVEEYSPTPYISHYELKKMKLRGG